MRVNIYLGNKLLENNKFFRSFAKAQNYCDYICPQKYGTGYYHFVIIK